MSPLHLDCCREYGMLAGLWVILFDNLTHYFISYNSLNGFFMARVSPAFLRVRFVLDKGTGSRIANKT